MSERATERDGVRTKDMIDHVDDIGRRLASGDLDPKDAGGSLRYIAGQLDSRRVEGRLRAASADAPTEHDACENHPDRRGIGKTLDGVWLCEECAPADAAPDRGGERDAADLLQRLLEAIHRHEWTSLDDCPCSAVFSMQDEIADTINRLRRAEPAHEGEGDPVAWVHEGRDRLHHATVRLRGKEGRSKKGNPFVALHWALEAARRSDATAYPEEPT